MAINLDFLNGNSDEVAKKGDIEAESKKEVTELQEQFRERHKRYKEDFKNYTDTNFWTCVVFQTKEQAMEFNEKMGFNPDESFIDGLELCKKIGVKLDSPVPKMPNFKHDKKLINLT